MSLFRLENSLVWKKMTKTTILVENCTYQSMIAEAKAVFYHHLVRGKDGNAKYFNDSYNAVAAKTLQGHSSSQRPWSKVEEKNLSLLCSESGKDPYHDAVA